MADVIGMADVSTPDTGKGSQLKTGGINRSYNMPNKEKCKTDWKKMGYESVKDCKDYGKKKTQSASSSKDEQNMVGDAIAKSKNARMKKRLKKNSMSTGY